MLDRVWLDRQIRMHSTPIRPWQRLYDAITHALRGAVVLAFALMVLVVVLDVLFREWRGSGLNWAMQIGVYANAALALLSMALTSSGDAHLRPRFADRWLPDRFDPLLRRLGDAGSALGFGLLAGLGLWVTLETRALDERGAVLGNPIWPIQLILPLSFALAALMHALRAYDPSLRAPPLEH